MKKKENDKSITKKNSSPRFLAPQPREGIDSEEEGSYDNYPQRIHGARNKTEISLSGAYQSDENLLQNGELTAKVFIAGAASNVGKAIAEEFVKQPTKQSIFLAGSHELPLKSVAEWAKAQAYGAEVKYSVGDYTESKNVDSAIGIADHFLAGHIDIFIVNTALKKKVARFEDTSVSDFEDLFIENVKSTFLWLQKAVKKMRTQKSGLIVLVSSTIALEPRSQYTAYSACSFALKGMVDALRAELNDTPIKICTVFADDVTPILARETPPSVEDIAKAVKFIVDQSNKCSLEQMVLKSTKVTRTVLM